jgi:HTH-type transcriptional regulator, competence development regulator
MLLKLLKASPREVEMAQYMTTNEVNPDWVAHVLGTNLTAEGHFEA